MNDMQIIAPNRREHFNELTDLTAKCFSYSGYWYWIGRCPKYFDDRIYDWTASRIGILDGKIVTHYGVWDHQVRIGCARVRMAGVGAVATHGNYRKRGLLLKTAAASMAGFAAAGYDMTCLFGIPNFYHKLGYVQGWAAQNWTVKIADLPTAETPVVLRKFQPMHRDDLADLYNRHHAELTGTAVRPTFFKCRNEWEGYLWRGAKGAVAGYVIVGDVQDKLQHIDSAGEPAMVLDVLRRIAFRKRHKLVEMVWLHHDSPLAQALRRIDCKVEAQYQKSGGAMVRTVNLHATLGKIAEELGRRLGRSHLATWCGELLIADPRERVTLAIDNGQIAIVEGSVSRAANSIRGNDEIARLLIGSASPAEIADGAAIKTTGAGRELLEALFPEQHPNLNRWDFY